MGTNLGFWVATGLFSLQMGFTAYAQLQLPQVVGTSMLWALSYLFFRRRQGTAEPPMFAWNATRDGTRQCASKAA